MAAARPPTDSGHLVAAPACPPGPSPEASLSWAARSSLSSCARGGQDCRGGGDPAQRSSTPARDARLLRAGEGGVFCPWPVVRGAMRQR